MSLISNLAAGLFDARSRRPQTDAAKLQVARDRKGLSNEDPGPQSVVHHGIAWLGRAQDLTASGDGGVARHYSLLSGWGTSYPETTGYIVPTMLEYSRRYSDASARDRARRMLDWLVSIQLPGGGFQGGRIDSKPVVPVTFNTGQILLGLAAGTAEFGDVYRPATMAAAGWLSSSLDADGCWRRHPTPFAAPGEKAYETHVAWGLFEAERVAPGYGFGTAGMKNITWALTKQRPNGWFADNCLSDPKRPLTHTIGYVLRGIVEAHRYDGREELLESALRTANGLEGAIAVNGFLAGCLDDAWRTAAAFACLTGNAQIAYCLLYLYQVTGIARHRDLALALNSYVRRTIDITGTSDVRGAVKGSHPVDGDYGRYEYLNWAVKFVVDSNQLELDVIAQDRSGRAPTAVR